MSSSTYERGEELAKLLAEYNVSSSQIQSLLQAFSRGLGEEYVRTLIRERTHRGFLPPSVANYLLTKVPKGKLKEVLAIASKLADYEYLRPLVEDWDMFKKYLKSKNITFNVEDIGRVEVARTRGYLVLTIYTKNKNLEKQAYTLSRIYSDYLKSRYNINIRVRFRVRTIGE